MLFESVDILNEMIGLIRAGPQQTEKSGQFRDLQDPEVDRLYTSSPFEAELAGTFEVDTPLGEDEKHHNVTSSAQEPTSKTNFENNPIISTRHQVYELFKPRAIPPIPDGPSQPSSLSILLNGGRAGPPSLSSSPAKRKGGIPLTIYLPSREPVQIQCDANSSVDELIRMVLSARQRKDDGSGGMSLHYHAPECYELRLHEGDGEPDEDFPAIDRQRALRQVGNVTEFCLCLQRGVVVPPSPFLSGSSASTVSGKESFALNMVMVTLPNSDHIKLRLEETTTCRDILPSIAKKHRIALYTDDYVFRLLPADQTRLMLSSPEINIDTALMPLKVQELNLERKVYADSPNETAATSTMSSRQPGEDDTADLSILYTDVTAAVYQEWAIVKKNKFGRMQERTLGIDGSKIYNSKRDGSSSRNVVHRAQRDISTVRRVSTLHDDSRAFRITYDDEGEVSDIEYFCDSARDCAEIVAKLKYLISKHEV